MIDFLAIQALNRNPRDCHGIIIIQNHLDFEQIHVDLHCYCLIDVLLIVQDNL